MKKSMLALAIMAAVGSSAVLAASPNVKGGTSNSSKVAVNTPSNHFMFGGGNSGLKLNGSILGYIDIAGGPVNGSNAAINARGDGTIMTPADLGLFGSTKIAQVWNATASVNGASGDYANFAINSVRQIDPPFFAPQFGGLVIGQVAATSTGAPADPVVPLAVGSGVYFGEWAPAVSNPVDDNTDLNMGHADRTVWYVGDNAVANMPELVEAEYNVVGIRRTGITTSGYGDNLPDSPDLYTGVLTANYDPLTTTGDITGSISRYSGTGADIVEFDKVGDLTSISSNGTFGNATGSIEGRFYNNATALAGIYQGGSGTADDVAFGGSYNGNGTITP